MLVDLGNYLAETLTQPKMGSTINYKRIGKGNKSIKQEHSP